MDVDGLGWHAGELAMHRAMHAPTHENPNWTSLTPNAAYCLQTSGVFAAGAVDRRGRPWTSIWGSEEGFATPLRMRDGAQTVSGVAVRCLVDARWDPVVQILRDGLDDQSAAAADSNDDAAGSEKKAVGRGVRLSGLPIDLMHRNRAKLAGTVIGAVLDAHDSKDVADLQVVLRVESSLGNCPKYLNQIPLRARVPEPSLRFDGTSAAFPAEATALISAAPLFFLTTSHAGASLSTNHRGGAPGFLRVLPAGTPGSPFPDSPHPVLVYPEYSGNRLYQSLGNLHETPVIGIAVPDFRTGDVLYATASGKMLLGADAARLMPRTGLAVALELLEWRLVQHGLAVAATGDAASDAGWAATVGWSPYNPPVRPLASELASGRLLPTPPPELAAGSLLGTATLDERAELAPGIARLGFAVEFDGAARPPAGQPGWWRAGQHAVLDFSRELGLGYRHMDDGDPASLNDDLLRTFTITSAQPPPASARRGRLHLTVRETEAGRATRFLLRANLRAAPTLLVRALAGDFFVRAPEGGGDVGAGAVAFVAGGIGVTPLLAQMPALRAAKRPVRVWWAVRAADVPFVRAVVREWVDGARGDGADLRVSVFVSGEPQGEGVEMLDGLAGLAGVDVARRRMKRADFEGEDAAATRTFYVCAGKELDATVQSWLTGAGKEVVSESFNF